MLTKGAENIPKRRPNILENEGCRIAFIQRLNCHFIQEGQIFQNLRRPSPLFPLEAEFSFSQGPSFYAENLLVGKGSNILLLDADIFGNYQGSNFCVCRLNLHSEGSVAGVIFSGLICWRLTFSGLVYFQNLIEELNCAFPEFICKTELAWVKGRTAYCEP